MTAPHAEALIWPPGEMHPRQGTIEEALEPAAGHALVWIIGRSSDERLLSRVAERYGFHELAMAAVSGGFQLPRAKDFGSHYLVVWHILRVKHGANHGLRTELGLLMASEVVVSVTSGAETTLATVRDRLLGQESLPEVGPDALLYVILDATIDAYFAVADQLAAEADALEDAMLGDPGQEQLTRLLQLKRRLRALRKTLSPERDVVPFLVRREGGVLRSQLVRYFQDLQDRLFRVTDSAETIADIASGAMDIYLSSVSNRLNEVMKKLTVVATVFAPATVISSFFGMNFVRMPGLGSAAAFWGVTAFMFALAAVMLVYFRRRDWW